mgnify:FL=1
MQAIFRKLRLAAAALLLTAFAAPAQAHFIFVVADPVNQGTQLQLSFGEGPEPAEAYLLDKVAHAQLWAVAADGSRSLVKLSKKTQGDEGAWVATAKERPTALQAVCQYGTFSRGGKTSLLNYFAQYVSLPGAVPAPGEELKLAVVPTLETQGIRLQVTWEGKPVSEGVEVVAAGPNGKDLEVKAADGAFVVPNVGSGRYVIRARLAQDIAGKLGDDAYQGVLNYSTLTLDIAK